MKQEKPLISVIVPVYNVEPYIEKCLASIAAQTYSNLEILIVDDASTDAGGRICDTFAAGDKRMQVVHFQENRGLSAARNEGVFRAKGSFVSFVDSDDYVEPGLLDKLYAGLSETGADISVCGACGLKVQAGSAALYSRAETVACLARRAPFLWTVWGKLYPMELVKRTPFDERAFCCEDLLFFYQILKQIEQVSYVPDRLYHYIFRKNSLINRPVDEKKCTVLSILSYICEDAFANFPEAVPGFGQVAMDTSMRLAVQAVKDGAADGKLSEYLKRFQRHIRRHFNWNALAMCPDKRAAAAVLTLYVSTLAFWGSAALHKRIKAMRRTGTKDWGKET
ncbi:MAG: glycosyltransferase family 2 protein [Lachnospiraceae bacterium]|nr:glycosyltransferase family 2 protein [Lachnospiraceae bacterium]